jgi:hypothetical protein
MLNISSIKSVNLLVLLLIALVAGCASNFAPVAQASPAQKFPKTVVVEVAQDMTSAVTAEAPLHDDGALAAGNRFIVHGFLYPEGTLNGSNGIIVTEDAEGNTVMEPEFPEKVIGTWTCRGWFIADGMHTQDAPWAVSTQIFSLGGQFGEETLVSEGYELPFGLDGPLLRAVTGGTGTYAGARGEEVQHFLGMNASQGANYRMEFTLDK